MVGNRRGKEKRNRMNSISMGDMLLCYTAWGIIYMRNTCGERG